MTQIEFNPKQVTFLYKVEKITQYNPKQVTLLYNVEKNDPI